VKRWLIALLVLLLGRRRQRPLVDEDGRIVPPGGPDRRAENLVLLLFGAATVCGFAFPVIYAWDAIPNQTQFLGLALGLALAFLAAACVVTGSHLVVTEELEEDYPPPGHPSEQDAIERLVAESGDHLTRRRLLLATGTAAGAAFLVALLTPVLSLGSLFRTGAFSDTPWRRGRRLVDEHGRALRADEIVEKTFYTAFPEGADRDLIGSPVVVVRLPPGDLRLPEGRRGWAPRGILAYSKICTHAGCAINLYRAPLYEPVEPKPALVCPCHYSTFDPAEGAKVIFGPAGRPLPQLPLTIDANGELRAAGNLSAAPGPSWWGARGPAT
jgi:ubiquinol-cytochrome c reductase iron-sulfur subunit